MQKRLISMVLALSMALSAMPLPALAQSAPPDTASAAALAEENNEVTNIYTDDWSGKPVGDLYSGSTDSWSYDDADNTLTLKNGTFRLNSISYSGYNNYIRWNVKIGKDATLQDAQIGSKYDNSYTVTNAGTISGGTFYGKVSCEAGAVIGGGTFKKAVTVDAASGEVTIDGGTFEYTVFINAVDTLTINGGTFTGGTGRSMEISDTTATVVINGGSFESAIKDHNTAATITINSGLFKSLLYGAAQNCTVNGGLFTAEDTPLSPDATVNGGCFTAKRTGLVAIDATDAPVYLPVAVAADGTVTEWSADAYSRVYVAPNPSVTLKPIYKLESIINDWKELDYEAENGAVSFAVSNGTVFLHSASAGELVIEADGFPKGTDGGVYGAKGNGWTFDPERKNPERFDRNTPALIIEKDATLDFDKVENNADTVKFAVENNGVFTGTLKYELTSYLYVYNKESGTIKNATLDGLNNLYNDGLVEDSVLRVEYIGNGWRETAQPATIRNSALDIIGNGWLLANSSTYKAVLDGCYNSAGYTGTATIDNGGTIKNSKGTLKLVVKNVASYNGNDQPIIDGGEYTVVYNKGGIIQGSPIIHALVAKDTQDLNGAADYYTLNYTAPESATYYEKYINGINGMIEGIWGAKVSILYVASIDDTISVITHAPIKSVNGVAYSGSVRYDTERYTSTIDLSKYNIPQTHVLNLSATGEGAAELPSADPADFTFTLPADLTYDGNPKRVEADVRENATKEYGAVTVTYKQDGKVLNGAPTEPGTYTFTAVVAATATCAGGDVTPKYNTFTIQKAALNPADITVKEPDPTYDGAPKEVTVKNTSDKDYGEITVTYKQNGEALNGVPTEPGEYSYTVTAAGSARYMGGTVKTGSFRITKTGTTDPEPEKTYKLTVTGADITLPEDADADTLKAGQLVSLTAYPDTTTERFAHWVVSGSDGKELTPADLMDAADEPLTEDAFKQRTLTFRMPAQNLNITAMTTPVEQLPEEDSTKFSPLQTVAIVAGTTAWFAGSAVMGYEAVTYSILADLLPKGTAIPRTREQLAVLLWSTAGKPEPTAPAVYSDVAEPDTAKAARWAVEAGLLPDMGEGVFTPGKRVTKVQVIRAWNQLKKLGLAK